MESGGAGDSLPATLHRHGIAPRKRLGQNFLRDRSYLRRIVDAAELDSADEVLELGAGTGVLTKSLLERVRRVVAVELDDNLYWLLQDQLGADPALELWHGNALDFVPSESFAGAYKLLGNIPYYITGPILRHFLEADHKPALLVLMVQKEVADRIVARPGDLSLLGASVQHYADARIVARVPAGAFYPIPKVDSAIVKLLPHVSRSDVSNEAFFRVVRAGFSARRKQIANSMSAGLGLPRTEVLGLLHETGIDEKRRAETLSIEEWTALAKRLERHVPLDAP